MSRAIFGGLWAVTSELVGQNCCSSRENPLRRRATATPFCPRRTRRGAEEGNCYTFFHGGHGGARRRATATPFVRGGRGEARRRATPFCPRRTRRGVEKGNTFLSAEDAERRGEGQHLFVRGGRGGAPRTAFHFFGRGGRGERMAVFGSQSSVFSFWCTAELAVKAGAGWRCGREVGRREGWAERKRRSAREMVSLALLGQVRVSCGRGTCLPGYQASWLMALPVSTVKVYGLSVSYWVSG